VERVRHSPRKRIRRLQIGERRSPSEGCKNIYPIERER
jgi:hypothetical protein